jgi:anti-sigma regulatory factor (Ser/Thr protein kinase)
METKIHKLMLEAGYAAPEIAKRAHVLAELVVKECAHAYHQTRSVDTTIEQHFRRHLGLNK